MYTSNLLRSLVLVALGASNSNANFLIYSFFDTAITNLAVSDVCNSTPLFSPNNDVSPGDGYTCDGCGKSAVTRLELERDALTGDLGSYTFHPNDAANFDLTYSNDNGGAISGYSGTCVLAGDDGDTFDYENATLGASTGKLLFTCTSALMANPDLRGN